MCKWTKKTFVNTQVANYEVRVLYNPPPNTMKDELETAIAQYKTQ